MHLFSLFLLLLITTNASILTASDMPPAVSIEHQEMTQEDPLETAPTQHAPAIKSANEAEEIPLDNPNQEPELAGDTEPEELETEISLDNEESPLDESQPLDPQESEPNSNTKLSSDQEVSETLPEELATDTAPQEKPDDALSQAIDSTIDTTFKAIDTGINVGVSAIEGGAALAESALTGAEHLAKEGEAAIANLGKSVGITSSEDVEVRATEAAGNVLQKAQGVANKFGVTDITNSEQSQQQLLATGQQKVAELGLDKKAEAAFTTAQESASKFGVTDITNIEQSQEQLLATGQQAVIQKAEDLGLDQAAGKVLATAQAVGDRFGIDDVTDIDAAQQHLMENGESIAADFAMDAATSLGVDPTQPTTLTFPILGAITFIPVQADPQQFGAQIQKNMEQTNKDYSFGPLQVTGLTAKVSPEGQPLLEGNVSFFNKTGRFELVEQMEGAASFKITPSAPLPLTINSELKTTITELFLDVAEGQQELYSEVSLFTPDQKETRITFGTTLDAPGAIATTPSAPLTKLYPPSKEHPDLRKIVLTDAQFTLPGILSALLSPDLTISGLADLSAIKLFGDARMGETQLEISIGASGLVVNAQGQEPIVFEEQDFKINNPLANISLESDGSSAFDIEGDGNITMPVLGLVNVFIKGQKEPDALNFIGRLAKNIVFNGVTITESSFRAYTIGVGREKILRTQITGIATILGHKCQVTLRTIRDGKTGKNRLEFIGKIADQSEIKPFANINGIDSVPELKNFTLKNPYVGISSQKEFFLGGDCTVHGVETDGQVRMSTNGLTVRAQTKKPWRMSDSNPALKGNPIDTIKLERVSFLLSMKDYFDPDMSVRVHKGITIIAEMSMDNPLFSQPKKMFSNLISNRMMASITLNPSPALCRIAAIIPVNVNLSKTTVLKNLALEASGEPSVAMLMTLLTQPTKKDAPLLFTSRLEFEIDGGVIAGTLDGMWKDPLGVKNFSIGDVAIEIKLPYAYPPIPTAFGIAGSLQMGKTKVKVATKLALDGEIILFGSANKVYLSDFVQAAVDAGVPIKFVDGLIDLKFEDVTVKFAPQGGMIGEFIFEPGITVEGKMWLDIPGIITTNLEAGLNVSSMAGVKAYAQMPTTKIGPLTFTGAGKDKKYGTKDDGPIFRFALTPQEQRMYLSAIIDFLGNQVQTEVDITLTSLKFLAQMKLLGVFDSKIFAETYKDAGGIGFQLDGQTKFGTADLSIIGDINTAGRAVIQGKLDHLGLKDLVEICNQLADSAAQKVAQKTSGKTPDAPIIKIPTTAIPNIGLSDLEVFMRI